MADIELDIDIPREQIRGLTRALADFQRKSQRDMADAVRTATVDVCKSLRRLTRKAPKYMPKAAFRFGQSEPRYLTTKDGRVMRRMIRKGFAPNKDLVFFQPVEYKYTSRRTKSGGFVESRKEQSQASLIRAARERFGNIANRGLAKYTWGWMMWRLFNIPNGLSDWINKRVRLTHRHVEARVDRMHEVLADGTVDRNAPTKYDITMVNRLRYIRRALEPGALEEAVARATKSLEWKAERCHRHAP